MHRSKWLPLLLVILLLGGLFSTVSAQDYRFSVPRVDIVAFVNQDGTVTVDYTYQFQNQAGAHVIDFVDIGIPAGSSVNYGAVTAEVDGKKITDISESTYVANAVALGLGGNAIPAGQSGTVHVTMPNLSGLLYPATEKETEAYASFQFRPNYFDSSLVTGKTDMAVTIVLPPGITEQEPNYYPPDGWPGDKTPGSGMTKEGRVFYTWESTDASSAKPYTFGASFPARTVPEGVISKPPPAGSTGSNGSSGPATITISNSLCPIVICLGFVVFFGAMIYFSVVSSRKRKLQYMPPKIAIEGHGIKRGLTPVEVGILMEQPMDKIMTMILFGVLKKEATEVVTKEPLALKVDSPLPEGLHDYEVSFLQAFQSDKPAERRKLLQEVMVNLVKSITQKMKGFSGKETIAYYEDIMKRAWEQVETAQTPEIKGETFEENLPWTLLDRRYEERTQGAFGTGPVFVPSWWWRYDPTLRPNFPNAGTTGGTMPASTGIPSSSGSRTIQLPNLPGATFAASVVNGVQNFSSGVLGNLTDFTSGVTNRTNPMPKPTTTYRGPGGGGGGGGHCACACACAGCACACAGGGR